MARKIGKYLSTRYILLIAEVFWGEWNRTPLANCERDASPAFDNRGVWGVWASVHLKSVKKDTKFNGQQIRFLLIDNQRHFYNWFSFASLDQ